MARRQRDFHGFYGQKRLIKYLKRQLHGAQALGKPFPHLLILGGSGMGKTTLAQALAKEYKTTIHPVISKARPADLCAVLVKAAKADLLFVDEAHGLPRDSQQLLLEVMDHHRARDWLGDRDKEARRDDHGRLVIEPVTFVLASDIPGGLANALQKRCQTVALDDYSEEELKEIAASKASDANLVLTGQALRAVARASQGQPRRIEQLLQGMANHFCDEKGDREVGHVRAYLKSAGMTPEGIEPVQRKYMKVLRRHKTASLGTLSRLVGVDEEYCRRQVEAGLIHIGYLRITNKGRSLTPAGGLLVKRLAQQARQNRQRKSRGSKGVDHD